LFTHPLREYNSTRETPATSANRRHALHSNKRTHHHHHHHHRSPTHYRNPNKTTGIIIIRSRRSKEEEERLRGVLVDNTCCECPCRFCLPVPSLSHLSLSLSSPVIEKCMYVCMNANPHCLELRCDAMRCVSFLGRDKGIGSRCRSRRRRRHV